MGAGDANNVDAVRSWVASGADINVVDDGGYTPLMEASHCQYAECVAEMLRLGADARRVNNNGRTALHLVAGRRVAGLLRVATPVEARRRLCGCWLRRGVTLRCVTTTAARLSSTHGTAVVMSGVGRLRGGLRRRWHERRRGRRRV